MVPWLQWWRPSGYVATEKVGFNITSWFGEVWEFKQQLLVLPISSECPFEEMFERGEKENIGEPYSGPRLGAAETCHRDVPPSNKGCQKGAQTLTTP